ncbi:hypothetical protein [Gemmatimonas sp.]|uniref:hypothetical protein n=1 Tax=Gemmatimonas sp. TaxID=1962908 RepID=UPI00286D7690|nr:hypothetical protein [Gemmatimonas sp.]
MNIQEARLTMDELCRDAQSVADQLLASMPPQAGAAANELADLIKRNMVGAKYHQIPEQAFRFESEMPSLAPIVAAQLLAQLGKRYADERIPTSIILQMTRQGKRILGNLRTAQASDISFQNDAFQKDLAMCIGEAWPCVAQVVERTAGIPRRLFFKGDLRQALTLGRNVLGDMKVKPYYEIHTHTPMLDGFTKEGWDQCYLLVADLLSADAKCLGMLGASWFYDPDVLPISPRLAYLREIPEQGGAFFLRCGSSEKDAGLATSTSATRREAFESGSYKPTSYMLVWRRDALLRWAEVSRSKRVLNET